MQGLNRSWNFSPVLAIAESRETTGFITIKRAYHLIKNERKLTLAITASDKQPLFNPVFIIDNGDHYPGEIEMKINGKVVIDKVDYQQGTEAGTDGKTRWVIWLEPETNAPAEIIIQ